MLYQACDYLSMLGFKLNHVSKRGLWCFPYLNCNTSHLIFIGVLFCLYIYILTNGIVCNINEVDKLRLLTKPQNTYLCEYGRDLNVNLLRRGNKTTSTSCFMIYIAILIWFNTLRPRQNDRHFPDGIFKWIFLNGNVSISINISLKFVQKGVINNMILYDNDISYILTTFFFVVMQSF